MSNWIKYLLFTWLVMVFFALLFWRDPLIVAIVLIVSAILYIPNLVLPNFTIFTASHASAAQSIYSVIIIAIPLFLIVRYIIKKYKTI